MVNWVLSCFLFSISQLKLQNFQFFFLAKQLQNAQFVLLHNSNKMLWYVPDKDILTVKNISHGAKHNPIHVPYPFMLNGNG